MVRTFKCGLAILMLWQLGGAFCWAEFLPNLTTEDLPPIKLVTGHDVAVTLSTKLPAGAKLTVAAPTRFKVVMGPGGAGNEKEVRIKDTNTTITLPLPQETVKSAIKATAVLYYCKAGNSSLCFLKSIVFNQPYELVAERSGPAPVVVNQVELAVVLQ